MKREEFEKEYRNSLKSIELPDALKNKLECVDCLKERPDICTLLTYSKEDHKNYILKIADRSRGNMLVCEWNILRMLADCGIRNFPAPIFLLEENGITYYVREYAEGDTLLGLAKRKGCMPEAVLLQTGIQLCRLLEILQDQNPPVIHRDLKPENIVYMKKNTFTFIDFETARRYSRGKSYDTLVMGSRPTAAPEQFGFAQTDCRTDIYGLGMTLLYLACGTYDKKSLEQAEISGRLRKIILKSVEFDPERRYQTAEKMRLDLIRCSVWRRLKKSMYQKLWGG